MLLQVVDLFRLEADRRQCLIDAAAEHKYGLFGVFRRKRRMLCGIDVGVESRAILSETRIRLAIC